MDVWLVAGHRCQLKGHVTLVTFHIFFFIYKQRVHIHQKPQTSDHDDDEQHHRLTVCRWNFGRWLGGGRRRRLLLLALLLHSVMTEPGRELFNSRATDFCHNQEKRNSSKYVRSAYTTCSRAGPDGECLPYPPPCGNISTPQKNGILSVQCRVPRTSDISGNWLFLSEG